MREPIVIGGQEVAAGTSRSIELPIARRYTANRVFVPVHVVHGKQEGPRLLVCAAVHGDEINGVEIVRRVLASPGIGRIRGSLIAVPIVNVYGFVAQTRYLPDRRDLNRSFPGSARGSLASRLAHTVMTELASNVTHAIDLHTGALHRDNLPQIRATLDDGETVEMARAFGVPVILHAALRDGSLREALKERGVVSLVYEAGEALRFDELSIRAGVRGVRGVMRSLGMLPSKNRTPKPEREPVMSRASQWVRAPESGIVRTSLRLGQEVHKDDVIALISDPLGHEETKVVAPEDGIVIGRINLPLVNEGDALFHIALFKRPSTVATRVEAFQDSLEPEDHVPGADPEPDD
jgi:predicted deacylase